MPISVEYLVLFNKSSTVCDSIDGLLHLLRSDSRILVEDETISFGGATVSRFQCTAGEESDGEHRYFRILFQIEADALDQQADARFRGLIRSIRTSLHGRGDLQLVWDELSARYATEGYPIVHYTENLMRRLIASLMLARIGLTWERETIPKPLVDGVKRSAKKEPENYLNVLHKLDFCQLGDFLFKPYAGQDATALLKAIESLKDDDCVAALRDFVPRSNWTRYFCDLVTCDGDYLRVRWDQIYDLRCSIAHNTEFTYKDLLRLKALSEEVTPHLLEAVHKVTLVDVGESETEAIAESVVLGVSEAVGEFVLAWQRLEALVVQLLGAGSLARIPAGQDLVRGGLLARADGALYDEVRAARNEVVHRGAMVADPEHLRRLVRDITSLVDAIQGRSMVIRLHQMTRKRMEEELFRMISDAEHQITDDEIVAGCIADTNASDFVVDETSIESIEFAPDFASCRAELSFSMSGEQIEDKMWGPTEIRGNAVLTIGPEDQVDLRVSRAEVIYPDDRLIDH